MLNIVPIGFVENERTKLEDDHWERVDSKIFLTSSFGEDSLKGIEDFSHLEILFYFHLVDESSIVTGARHPRNNKHLPLVGIFSQRGKSRPNRIGSTIVELIKQEGSTLYVKGLDAIDGTPVLDIKPVMEEFLPKGVITQPEWSKEVMKSYW
ncbi:SAM-dependent methyltransferase [Bacillus carboniphilus]|uniref:SAM-dependent methyltransferase n=1 Tax=Bacillus carboniphilus TaxID=86663 RepID=A0ABY9JWR4_9BACI|nr:SAM-dependent methyltransferase [Bacillus carboniphilus]WLR42870.1 SAM-dependent methyltransferase [Bacillus carboniphilus]